MAGLTAGGVPADVVRMAHGSRLVAVLASSAALLAAVGCGADSGRDIEALENPTRTTLEPYVEPHFDDTRDVALAPVAPGPAVAFPVAIRGGEASLAGTLTGPDGPVARGRVRIERFVGSASAVLEVTTNAAGRWRAKAIQGGRYRVRGWRMPDLAMNASTVLFLGADETRGVDLSATLQGGIDVQADLLTAVPTIDVPVTVSALITRHQVDGDGIVQGIPLTGTTAVLTTGAGWEIVSPQTTVDGAGEATWTLRCQTIRPADLVVSSGAASARVTVPACNRPAPPTSVTTPEEPVADFPVGSTFTPPFAGPLPAGTYDVVGDPASCRVDLPGVARRRLERRPGDGDGHQLAGPRHLRPQPVHGGQHPALHLRACDMSRRSKRDRVKPYPRPKHRRRWWGIPRMTVKLAVLVAVLVGVCIPAAAATAFWTLIKADVPGALPTDRNPRVRSMPTTVYDAEGNPISQFREFDLTVPTRRGDIPQVLIDAVVAVEDRNFWEHDGVDPEAIVRAALSNFEEGETVEGGSTITQQYIKNTYTTGERNISRKLREALLASRLEREVLEGRPSSSATSPVSTSATAPTASAPPPSRTSASRSSDLTASEAALLAGTISSPNNFGPRVNADVAEQRRMLALRAMRDEGYLTLREFRVAREEHLWYAPFGDPPGPATVVHAAPQNDVQTVHPYFVDYVRRFLAARFDHQTLYRGGLRVETTIDPRLQLQAQQSVARTARRHGAATGDVAGHRRSADRPREGHGRAAGTSPPAR